MTRALLLLAAALTLPACGGEVTDGGTGSDTDFAEIANEDVRQQRSEAEQVAAADEAPSEAAESGQRPPTGPDDPRPEDYPDTGEEQTRNPIEPGNEEPGGKDLMLASEYEALGEDAPSAVRQDLEAARREAGEPVALYQDRLYLSRNGVSLDYVGREPVMVGGTDDEYEVADALVASSGKLVGFVVQEKATLGVPGSKRLAPVDALQFERPTDDANMRLSIGDQGRLQDFDEDSLPADTLLASSLFREPIDVGSDEEMAAVSDLVLNTDGTVFGIAVAYVGQQYLVEPDELVLAQGDGGYELTLTEEELQAKQPYVGVPAFEKR